MAVVALEEALRGRTADAWAEYRSDCERAAGHSEERYQDVEPWAWARLQQALRAIRLRANRARP